MTNFNRERLEAVLVSAGFDASHRNIKKLDAELDLRRLVYLADKKQIIGVVGASKELRDVHRSLRKWLDRNLLRDQEDDLLQSDYEITVVTEGDEVKFWAVLWFFGAIAQAIRDLEENRPRKRKGTPEARLFANLYRVYGEFNGGFPHISDDGPAIRFVTGCAKLLDPGIYLPGGHALRDRISQEIKRQQKSHL